MSELPAEQEASCINLQRVQLGLRLTGRSNIISIIRVCNSNSSTTPYFYSLYEYICKSILNNERRPERVRRARTVDTITPGETRQQRRMGTPHEASQEIARQVQMGG